MTKEVDDGFFTDYINNRLKLRRKNLFVAPSKAGVHMLYKLVKALEDIYFYSALGLANELRAGSVSEVRAVKHLVASIILGGVGFEVPVSVDFQAEPSGFVYFASNIVLFIVMGVISYYGVWQTHQVNGKGDGKDYFLRFAALTLPIGVQLAVLFLGVGLLLVLLAVMFESVMGDWGVYLLDGAYYLAAIAFITMFFIRMKRFIGVASSDAV